jgi:adenylate cyclase
VAREIERKYLIERLPDDLERHPSEPIDQGYLTAGGEGAEVRVRRRGEATVLTVKAGAGRSREEEELAIDPERFERLWRLTAGRRLRKRRHRIPLPGGVEAELDVYLDALEGLRVVEVEFPSEEAADAFRAPAWFGPEITGDARYSNRELAERGAPPA